MYAEVRHLLWAVMNTFNQETVMSDRLPISIPMEDMDIVRVETYHDNEMGDMFLFGIDGELTEESNNRHIYIKFDELKELLTIAKNIEFDRLMKGK